MDNSNSSNKGGGAPAAGRRPVWARPSWFKESYGLSYYLLAKAAEEGNIRRFKPKAGGGVGAAVVYNVADVDAWLEGRAEK